MHRFPRSRVRPSSVTATTAASAHEAAARTPVRRSVAGSAVQWWCQQRLRRQVATVAQQHREAAQAPSCTIPVLVQF